ncbi:MAG: hypothetical protein JSU98_07425 [Gemmatimonadales bacterium]|jgi:hypothetical protein|nr:MAG: hypothetical protein JSU98_07425 [Gemmatimonadales bacterium]
MTDSIQEEADRLLEAAMEARGARDPREFYRTQLRELREADAAAYQMAVAYYRDSLIPSIARDGVDPMEAWTEYGKTLADLRAEGRTVSVDPTGRAAAYESPAAADHLVLHLPEENRVRAILVALPPQLSPAQRATYDWLVAGRNTLREE